MICDTAPPLASKAPAGARPSLRQGSSDKKMRVSMPADSLPCVCVGGGVETLRKRKKNELTFVSLIWENLEHDWR